MNAELEKLIDLALADGQLTEKEKQILTRKAKEFGVDEDEFEMVLEGKLHLAQKAMNQSIPPVPVQTQQTPVPSNKEGSLKKCPSCGAPTQAFATKCPECGHEFRGIQTSGSVQKLFETLNELEGQRQSDSIGGMVGEFIGKGFGIGGGNKMDQKKKEAISSFPVPNTKEDILEFLSLAFPKAKKISIGFFESHSDRFEKEKFNSFVPVWKSKCEQVIMKARFSMKNDKMTLDEIEHYAKELGIK